MCYIKGRGEGQNPNRTFALSKAREIAQRCPHFLGSKIFALQISVHTYLHLPTLPTLPLPTVDDVTSRLTKAKVFGVMDAKSAFWQVKLTESSSYYITFNTSFVRFRWLRMPFGISSAPEVWERNMKEPIEGLRGVQVIADDSLVCGFEDTAA